MESQYAGPQRQTVPSTITRIAYARFDIESLESSGVMQPTLKLRPPGLGT
jgi:hypothetical protein